MLVNPVNWREENKAKSRMKCFSEQRCKVRRDVIIDYGRGLFNYLVNLYSYLLVCLLFA